jgi:hypothetical protein
MLRSATTNEQVATMLRQFIEKAVLAKAAEAKGITRELVALLAPMIQQYFDAAWTEVFLTTRTPLSSVLNVTCRRGIRPTGYSIP